MRLVSLLLTTLSLCAANLKIDHVTIAGSNLDAMRKAFTAATRIPTEYGGPHSNHATEMALVSFPDGSYLELMGIQANPDPAAVSAHTWSRFLRNNGGPCAFALRVPDVGSEVARLKALKIRVGKPETRGRMRPDSLVLSWETADVGAGPRGSFFPFLIRDFTPREKRVYPSGKPTTRDFGGIGKVVIGVRDLDSGIAQYRHAFDLSPPQRAIDSNFDAEVAWFEDAPIVLAKGVTSNSWLARRVRDYGEAPCAFLLYPSRGILGRPSHMLGHTVFWGDEKTLGWRLGVLAK